MTGIALEEIGMHKAMAGMFAHALARGLRRQLGGQDGNIPAADNTERHTAIRRAFNGGNVDDIVRRSNSRGGVPTKLLGARGRVLVKTTTAKAMDLKGI